MVEGLDEISRTVKIRIVHPCGTLRNSSLRSPLPEIANVQARSSLSRHRDGNHVCFSFQSSCALADSIRSPVVVNTKASSLLNGRLNFRLYTSPSVGRMSAAVSAAIRYATSAGRPVRIRQTSMYSSLWWC